MASKTDKRAKEILRLLLSSGKLTVEELSSVFSTSPASVRRDLTRLEEKGLVHRTHGGAMLAQQKYEPFRFDAAFNIREQRFSQEKRRIAMAAAELIQPGETIGFTAGTTTTEVARLLQHHSGLHIVTNAVNIALELGANPKLETLLTGGCIRWPGAFSLVGPTAIESLELIVLDKLFLGTCGVHIQHGVTTIEADEAAVFRAMARQAKQVIVLADSSKVGVASPAVICPLRAIDILITDDGISDEAADLFGRSDVQMIVV